MTTVQRIRICTIHRCSHKSICYLVNNYYYLFLFLYWIVFYRLNVLIFNRNVAVFTFKFSSVQFDIRSSHLLHTENGRPLDENHQPSVFFAVLSLNNWSDVYRWLHSTMPSKWYKIPQKKWANSKLFIIGVSNWPEFSRVFWNDSWIRCRTTNPSRFRCNEVRFIGSI